MSLPAAPQPRTGHRLPRTRGDELVRRVVLGCGFVEKQRPTEN